MIIIADQHIFHAPNGCTDSEFTELRRLNISVIPVANSCISTFLPRAYKKWPPEDMPLCWCGMLMRNSLPKESLRELASTFPHDHKALNCISAGVDIQFHRTTGKDLPPELITPILHAMAPDSASSRGNGHGDLPTLAACALVCRYWATTCRPILLKHRLLNITSHNMVRSVQCMMRWKGSERIGSLRPLVAKRKFRVKVCFDHDEETNPWLHHVQFLGVKAEAIDLTLTGTSFANYMRTSTSPSPYGNISIPSPARYAPFTTVALSDFHAFSFNTLIKLLQHFKRARTIWIGKVTWEPRIAQGVVPFHPPARSRNSIGVGPLCVAITAKCTDRVLLCLQTCLLYSDFPLCAVSAVERSAIVLLLRKLIEEDDDIDMSWDGTEDTVRFTMIGRGCESVLSFTCPRQAMAVNGLRDRSVRAICFRIGCSPRLADYTEFGAALHSFPSLLNVVISFDATDRFSYVISRRMETPKFTIPEHIALNLACKTVGERSSPTSRYWELFNAATYQLIARFTNHDSMVLWLLNCRGVSTTNAPGLPYVGGALMDAPAISRILKPYAPFCFFSLTLVGIVVSDSRPGSTVPFNTHLKKIRPVIGQELLVLQDDPCVSRTGAFIRMRTFWPGYSEHTTYMPHTVGGQCQWPEATSIDKETLAAYFAQAVRVFYDEAIPSPVASDDEVAASYWSLEDIPFDKLRLLDLHCVSADLWQPVLWETII
ncbi:hypothetical protein BC835DRAFT_1310728 [Cytidiella melzeri]|nr:hypothetical protein BC835DRAFT_1310728 [Cytidiella melzeri]